MSLPSAPQDISELIISNSTVEKNLTLIFSDSIILNTQFRIVNLSDSVLKLLNYETEELKGMCISTILRHKTGPREELIADLSRPFFQEKEYEILTKKGHELIVGISGFYLGLISDINGYVVLKLKNLNEVKKVYEQLQYKTMELDHFLYRTSHDLRGPLATIRGLANVAKLDNKETHQFYFDEILKQAAKLDDSLRSLMHIANSGANEFEYMGLINYDKIEDILRHILSSYDHTNKVALGFQVKKLDCHLQISETYLLTLLKNILLFILELEKKAASLSISIEISSKGNFVEIRIQNAGFFVSSLLAEKLNQKYLSCMDALKESSLVRFYAARKIVHQLNGVIGITMESEVDHEIELLIPIS